MDYPFRLENYPPPRQQKLRETLFGLRFFVALLPGDKDTKAGIETNHQSKSQRHRQRT